MLLFCFLFFAEPTTTLFSLDAIYKPLTRSKVAVAPSGHLYVLDGKAKKVYHFDENGTLLSKFSRQGEGPGELKAPKNIIVYKKSIYITDYYQGTQVFDLLGKFKYSQKSPKPFSLLDIVVNGWVYQVTDNQKGTTEIFWADPTLEGEESLLVFEVPEKEMFFQLAKNSIKVHFRPGLELPVWHLDQNRETLFVFIPGSKDLVVIDLLTRMVTANWPIPFDRQPMNAGWANHEAAALKQRITLNGKRVSISMETTIPEHFPIISDFFLGPQGSLWLLDGPSLTKKHIQAKVLSSEGKTIHAVFPPAEVERIIAAKDDDVWFLSFDKEKEIPILRKCKRKDLLDQLAQYSNESGNKGPKPLDIRTQ